MGAARALAPHESAHAGTSTSFQWISAEGRPR
jgi:hypothetical protein